MHRDAYVYWIEIWAAIRLFHLGSRNFGANGKVDANIYEGLQKLCTPKTQKEREIR